MLTTKQIKRILRAGPYAWPGGYPVYFITSDGCPLSFQAVCDNWPSVCHSTLSETNDGWRLAGAEVNWEDPHLYCEHTSERIESAYADDIHETSDDIHETSDEASPEVTL